MATHFNGEAFYLENGILKGRLRNADGQFCDAQINLDACIGNNDGAFEWGTGGFTKSAREIKFAIEGADNQPILRAQLARIDGVWMNVDLNLVERISNQNGCFVYQ